MATRYGVEESKLQLLPQQRAEQGTRGGRMKALYDSYTSAGALTSGDIIKMGKLPAGARIVGANISHTDHGATGTAVVGWADNGVDGADNDGIFTTLDINTAAAMVDMAEQVPAGLGQKFSAETDIQIELTANTTVAGSFKLVVFYIVD
jgi:hypothetical protein